MTYPIREDIPRYLEELRGWLKTQETVPLEEMSDYFASGIHVYGDHMMLWKGPVLSNV